MNKTLTSARGPFNAGFTLLELLVTVMIIGILSSIALPNYSRSVEKARATEAMNIIKSANDAVYAFASERNRCPDDFKKLVVEIPGTKTSATVITGKFFEYRLNAATSAPIPGTGCGGVVAKRTSGDIYCIWNPYHAEAGGKRTLACTSSTARGQNICKSMGIYTTTKPNGGLGC